MNKIAIVILHGLGDCISVTTLLRPLRLKYPKAHITWITAECYAPVVAHNPHINSVRTYSNELRLERSLPLIAELKKEFGSNLIVAGPYFNPPSKDNTLSGSHKDRIAKYAPGIKVDFIPEMYFTQTEVDEGIKWVNDKQLNKFIMLEMLFSSSQSFWNRTHTNSALEILNKNGYTAVLTHRTEPAIDELNKICRTVCLDVDYRYIPGIYNKASAFIGVSSGISCLVHSHQCRNDIPHLEFVNGEHWCTRAYAHKLKKTISFDPNQVTQLIEQLVSTLHWKP